MTGAALTDALREATPRDATVRPADHPGAVWMRCPACEPSGHPNRLALTLPVEGSLECRNGCSDEAIWRASGLSGARPHTERTSHADRERTSRTNTESTSLPKSDDVLSLSSSATAAARLSERLSARHRLPLLGTDREAVERILLVLGVDDCWHDFPCLLDGHTGSASVFLDPRKDHPSAVAQYKYACWCDRPRVARWTLAELRNGLARHTDPRRLRRQLAATWWARLGYDAGLLEPEPVELPNLAELQESHWRVAQGFALLVGLRRLIHPDTSVAFSRDFAAAWCAVTEWHAYTAICAMKAQGILIEAARDGLTPLYLPGSVHREAIDDHTRQRYPELVREAA